MACLSHTQILNHVEKVSTWNPRASKEDTPFTYIDLSSVDQNKKEICTPSSILPADAPSRARQLVFENDVLISTVRPNLNAVALVPAKFNGATASTGFCVLRPNQNTLDSRYLFHWVQNKTFIKDMVSRTTGANYPAISDKIIKESSIPTPKIEEQKSIAAILDKAHSIRQKREQNLKNADALIKSIFLDMFGDPITNPKGWEVKPVIEYCDCMVPGRDKPKTFTGDIPWITIDDLVVNGITVKSKKQLGLTLQEISDVRRKTIPAGSVIMSCVGNLGICSIAGIPLVINQQLHSFQCKKDMNNFFLMFYLGCRKDYMEKMATSTTLLYMNKETCNSIPAICPPIDLQNKFAEIVTKIEAQKTKQNQHLHEANQCFKALQQQFFG